MTKRERRTSRFVIDVRWNSDYRQWWGYTHEGEMVVRERVKAAAVQKAIKLANHAWRGGCPAQVFIRKRNGQIQEERTYGNDPRRRPG